MDVGLRVDSMKFALEQSGPPVCPLCHLYCSYLTAYRDTAPDTPEPVVCGCGWKGEYVRLRTLSDSGLKMPTATGGTQA